MRSKIMHRLGKPLYLFALQSIVFSFPSLAQAQRLTVGGKVADPGGAPLPGVSIVVKGSTLGTSSEPDGNYTLQGVAPDDTLVFTFLGFQPREVPVNGQQTINVTLTSDTRELEQVVVVGYGTQKREDVTGAISSISAKALREVPVTQASQSLQGRAAGVYVTSSGNDPGDGATIRIRGNRSFAASNDPLFVVDGIPITGGLQDVNPADIESIEVLKDASSTAIYGSRGANGVVIVTTKRGTAGKTLVSYNAYAGISEALAKADMMNGPEFAEYKRESRRTTGEYTNDEELFEPVELESIRLGRWTDYQELLLENGFSQNHQLSVSGGAEKTQFNISFNFFQDKGIIPGQDFTRYTTRVNVDQEIGERFKIGTSTLGGYNIQDGDDLNPYDDALSENPLGVPYDEEGNLIFTPTNDGLRTNPLNEIVPGAYVNREKRFRLFSSIYGEATLAEGLKFRLNFGPDLIQHRLGNFQGKLTNARRGGISEAQGYEDFVFNYTLENILTYNRTFAEKHSVDITGLYSFQSRQFEESVIRVRGIPVENMQYFEFGAAEEILEANSQFEKWNIQSYMARINYGYDSRYLLTLTGRLDGSSRFGENHRYGFFPSAAFAWNIINEEFMKGSTLFDNLKLRLSYGEVGNTGIDPYQTQGLLSRTSYAFGDDPAFGFRPSQLRNDDLKWETTASFNAGIDFSVLKSRISGTVEFYQQNTSDLLMERQLPYTSGFGSVLENVGATRNTGLEVTLSTLNIQS
ncbi:MAG TPA: TonB-dependent receptor, partial [Anseongella sp.]|nr:TonB-dependent receptor [Anseongella sp.]